MSQQINLFSPLFLRKKRYFSALTMVQALAAVLAGSAAIYAFELWQNATLEAALAGSDKQVLTQREQLLKLSKEFSALAPAPVLRSARSTWRCCRRSSARARRDLPSISRLW